MDKSYILLEGSEDLIIYSYIIKNVFNMNITPQDICTDINCEFKVSGGFRGFKAKLTELYQKYDNENTDIKNIGVIQDRDDRNKDKLESNLREIFNKVFGEYAEDINFYPFVYEGFTELEKLLHNTKQLDSKIADCFLKNFIEHCKNLDKNDYQLEKLAYKNWLDMYIEIYCSEYLDIKEQKKKTLKNVFKHQKVKECFNFQKDEKFLLEFQEFLNNFKE
jgi:hypothetical protein